MATHRLECRQAGHVCLWYTAGGVFSKGKRPFVFGMFNKSLTVVMSLDPDAHCGWPGSGAPAFMEFIKAIATVQEALLGSCET